MESVKKRDHDFRISMRAVVVLRDNAQRINNVCRNVGQSEIKQKLLTIIVGAFKKSSVRL